MAVRFTEKEYSQHVNTKFHVEIDGREPLELDLVEVKPYEYKDKPGEEQGMERFSLFFQGSPEVFLPQQIYRLTHAQLGDLQLFLVPIGQNEQGFRYEAVFSYMVSKSPEPVSK